MTDDSEEVAKKLDEILEKGMPGGLAGEVERWLNWRHESAKVCWMCGSTDTHAIDIETRECKQCETLYSVFKEPDGR